MKGMEGEHKETRVTNRNANSAKDRPKKLVYLEQEEKNNPALE